MGSASRRGRGVALLVTAAVLALVATACQPTEPWMKVPIAGFTPVSHKQVGSLTGDQGPATVHYASGTTKIVYGNEQVAQHFKDEGWTHLGDPDSVNGYIAYPYQAANPADGKMFDIITPHGRSFEYTHALEPGEEYNNSFAAISPDGQWLVSGEWDTESRLLVFPMPMMNASIPAANGPLPLAATIELSLPLSQVQGCDFISAKRLICSVDDDTKRLVAVDLPAALSGHTTTGKVTTLGKIPQFSTCAPSSKGGYEAEGVDYDPPSRRLLVQIIPPPPCFAFTDQYAYHLN